MKNFILLTLILFIPSIGFSKTLVTKPLPIEKVGKPNVVEIFKNKTVIHNLVKISQAKNRNEISKIIEETNKRINQYAEKSKLTIYNSARAIVMNKGDDKWTTSSGYRISKIPKQLDREFEIQDIKKGNYLKFTHVGSYNNLPESYKIIKKWAEEKNYKLTGPLWEIYANQKEKTPEDKLETVLIVAIK